MTAAQLLDCYGGRLVGRQIITQAIGSYVGGIAKIIGIIPDVEAPEIVFQVQHPTWRDKDDPESDGTIGIFHDEQVQLVAPFSEIAIPSTPQPKEKANE